VVTEGSSRTYQNVKLLIYFGVPEQSKFEPIRCEHGGGGCLECRDFQYFHILVAHDWDWLGAEKKPRRAGELAPHLPEVHYVRSQWCLVNGRSDEAIAEARRTLELDPLSLPNIRILP